MSKHTPGPWHVHGPRFAAYDIGTSETYDLETRIASVAARTTQVTAANARLIAAAPELLAACEAALTEPLDVALPMLRAAIAKAKP